MSEHQSYKSEDTMAKAQGAKALSTGRAIVLLLVVLAVGAILAATGIIGRIHARTAVADQTRMRLPLRRSSSIRQARGQPQQEIVLPGNLEAYTDSPIYARTNGYLKKWYFDIGAHVRKGQLLADIESPEVDQQLRRPRPIWPPPRPTPPTPRAQANRYQELVKTDAVSQQDTENFKTQAASGDTAVKSARANVQRLSELVGFEKVYAPFDGVVTAQEHRHRPADRRRRRQGTGATELFHIAAAQTSCAST